MGAENDANFFGELIDFRNNTVLGFDLFDNRNLFKCEFLNLRKSAFNQIQLSCSKLLRYIDISFSKINKIDVRGCKHLL